MEECAPIGYLGVVHRSQGEAIVWRSQGAAAAVSAAAAAAVSAPTPGAAATVDEAPKYLDGVFEPSSTSQSGAKIEAEVRILRKVDWGGGGGVGV